MQLSKPKKRIDTGNEAGFVILEALIAAAIFGVVMTAVVYTMTGAMKTNSIAKEISEATSLGANVIEQLSMLPYNDPNLQNASYTDGKYSFDITIQQDEVLDNTMSITVTVSWQNRGQARQVIINDTKINYI